MEALCKMTHQKTIWPCATPGCPLFGDCIAEYQRKKEQPEREVPDDLEYVMKNLAVEERLCQLAEEAAEMGQAALKLRRVLDGKNPTPVTFDDAFKNLREEVADVMGCLITVGMMAEPQAYQNQIDAKMARWAKRLQEKQASREASGNG